MARKSELEKGIDKVITKEGGFVNHPLDRGGPTNRGITLDTLRRIRENSFITVEQLKALTKEETAAIYYLDYVVKPRLNLLEEKVTYPPLLHFMVDTSVHHGPIYAVKLLQGNLGVKVDGVIGPVTLAEFDKINHWHLLLDLIKDRINEFFRIVFNDPSQEVFLKGWINRVTSFIAVK